jgi:hypothetical protein
MAQDLGYSWIVYARREDLPPVAQGHSAKVSTTQTLVELILLSEDLAARGELTGPGGKVWTCRLDDSGDAEDAPFPKGRPRWEPERPR